MLLLMLFWKSLMVIQTGNLAKLKLYHLFSKQLSTCHLSLPRNNLSSSVCEVYTAVGWFPGNYCNPVFLSLTCSKEPYEPPPTWPRQQGARSPDAPRRACHSAPHFHLVTAVPGIMIYPLGTNTLQPSKFPLELPAAKTCNSSSPKDE